MTQDFPLFQNVIYPLRSTKAKEKYHARAGGNPEILPLALLDSRLRGNDVGGIGEDLTGLSPSGCALPGAQNKETRSA